MNAAKKTRLPPSLGAGEYKARYEALGRAIEQVRDEADALGLAMVGIRLEESMDAWRASRQQTER